MIYYIPSSCSGVNSTSGSLSLLWISWWLLPTLTLLFPASLSDWRNVGLEDEWECKECKECKECDEVERDCLSFLKGRVIAFVPFRTDFLRDAALPEMREDLVEEVSVDFTMKEILNCVQLTFESVQFIPCWSQFWIYKSFLKLSQLWLECTIHRKNEL